MFGLRPGPRFRGVMVGANSARNHARGGAQPMRKMLLPIFAALITAAITAGLATGGGGGGGGNNEPRGPRHVRDRALGRPALLDRPGDGRRAEPDRGHEQAGPRVHRPRRRSQGRLGSDPCTDAALHPGARLPQLAAGAGRLHAGRQRLDRLRPHRDGGTHSLDRLDNERKLFFSTPFSLGPASAAAGRADRRRCASA